MRSVRRSIELNPENPDALYLIGFILGDLGRSEEAAEANRRAVMLNPTLVRAQANLSLETYRHEVTPSHQQRTPAGAHITLGRALRQKGYFQEALKEYEKAIEGGEANAEVLQAMLELYLLQRDTGAAIATADRFAREFSPTAKTWNGRGVALQLEGRHAEAEESYKRALEIDSSYPFAHNNHGVLVWHKGDTKSAINSFRRALQAPSPPVEARLNPRAGLVPSKAHRPRARSVPAGSELRARAPGGVERDRTHTRRARRNIPTRETRLRAPFRPTPISRKRTTI